MSGSLAGAVITTFFAPAVRCLAASSRLVKSPVDSNTTSTPRSFHGSCAGSRIDSTLNSSPSTEMLSPLGLDLRVQVAEHRVVLEQMRERCALVRSLTATKSMFLSPSAARMMLRPMRPNPLIPTLTAIDPQIRSARRTNVIHERACEVKPQIYCNSFWHMYGRCTRSTAC